MSSASAAYVAPSPSQTPLQAADQAAPSGVDYPQDAVARPIRTFVIAVTIVFMAVLVACVLPGTVAWMTGVFTEKQVQEKFCSKDVFLKTDSSSSLGHPSDAAARRRACTEFTWAWTPVRFVPFYTPSQLWDAVVYFTLVGWLVRFCPPPRRERQGGPNEWAVAKLTILLYLLTLVPHLLRNLWWDQQSFGRTVFAYANLDIDPWSFVTQEFGQILSYVLLAIFWLQWGASIDARWSEDRSDAAAKQRMLANARLERMSRGHIQWQVMSVLLAIPFLLNLLFYWDKVIQQHDARYIPNAVVMHVIWGTSWALISLPLAIDWYRWHIDKMQALTDVASASESSFDDKLFKALSEFQPVAMWNVVGTGVVAIAAFAAPLVLQALH